MQLDIRTCTAREIVGHPSFPALRREYADEAAVAGLSNDCLEGDAVIWQKPIEPSMIEKTTCLEMG